MKKTLFAALAICTALASCDTCKNTNSCQAENIAGKWLIVSAGNVTTDSAEQMPFINFTDSGMVNGYTAANNFFGYYSTDGDSLCFDQLGVTFMLGTDADMDIEAAVVQALNNSKTFEMQDTVLRIKDAHGTVVMSLKRD